MSFQYFLHYLIALAAPLYNDLNLSISAIEDGVVLAGSRAKKLVYISWQVSALSR